MPTDPHRNESTRFSVALRVDQLCDEFEASWRSGNRPQISAFLDQVPSPARATLFRELLVLELDYRAADHEIPCEEEYTDRYPEYACLVQDALADTVSVSRRDIITSDIEGVGAHNPRATVSKEPEKGTEQIPVNISKYRVIGRLGSGGQGEVFRAVHPQLDRDVVIKLSRFRKSASGADHSRLVEEGQVLAEIDHPNLARVYDFDFHDGCPFLVMEYVRGMNLRQFAQQTSLSPQAAALLVARVALAASAAHERGVLHQDIKPDNIVVDADGNPRLIDFGLARLRHAWQEDRVEPGSIAGTASYMAPEQARGETQVIDQRSDVFALGAVLYFLLVGRAPFQGKTFRESLAYASICQYDMSALDAPHIPKKLRAIVLSAMESEIGERCPAASVLANDLNQFAQQKQQKWHFWAAGIGLSVILASLLFAAVGYQGRLGNSLEHGGEDSLTTKDTIVQEDTDRHEQLSEEVVNTQEPRVIPSEDLPETNGHPQESLIVAWKPSLRIADAGGVSVSFSPNGERLGVGGISGGGRVHDSTTGAIQLRVTSGTSEVQGMLFSPDGKWLAVTRLREQIIQILDASTDEVTYTLRGHNDFVQDVAFNNDGERLVSGGKDGTARLWDTDSGKQLAVFDVCHHSRSTIMKVAFSPTANHFATGTAESPEVVVWDASSGNRILTLKGHAGGVFGLAFSPDGKSLVSGGQDCTVRVWDSETGQEKCCLEGHTDELRRLTVSQDGRWLASAAIDRTIRIWDLRIGQQAYLLEGHDASVNGVAFSPDGKRLASVGNSDLIVWEAVLK